MVAGYDKYFQIARCLRDEDLRADRQPEFTQLDVEMSFVEMDDILRRHRGADGGGVSEVHRRRRFRCHCRACATPRPCCKYGSDKPDLRYGLEIVEFSDLAAANRIQVFQDAIAAGGKVRGLNVEGAAEKFSRKGLDELTEYVSQFGAKGLAWIKVEADKFTSPIEKFLPAAVQATLRQRLNAAAGDLLLFVADKEDVVCPGARQLRTHLAATLEAVGPDRSRISRSPGCCDFPSFIWDDEEKRWAANHHPFTAPKDEDLAKLESDPGSVRRQGV